MTPEAFDLGQICLRRPRPSDAAAIFDYAGDPEVAHYADWPVRTSIDPLIDYLQVRAARWDAGTEFHWVLTLPAEDRAIGGISCMVAGHSAEIGFLVARRHWGQGFATHASRAIVDWVSALPTVWRVWATCDTENVASARVLEKAGLTREGILRRWVVRPNISGEPRDAFMYARTRSPVGEAPDALLSTKRE